MNSEFKFFQGSEFSDPYYKYLLDGDVYGYIEFSRDISSWQGKFVEGFIFSSWSFLEMAEKINALNESLDNRRSWFRSLN